MQKKNMRIYALVLSGLVLIVSGGHYSPDIARADKDNRELVTLPPMMQQHMLANMRDHLVALDEIMGELGAGNVDKAGEIAENRLGMTSMSLHGAGHMAKYMPEGMQVIGTNMHHAASQFVITARNAELVPGRASQRKVFKALQAITENCNACHKAYRIR